MVCILIMKSGQAKITKFNIILFIKENILGF